jgi:esterase/lipase superfamily enzyme
MKDNEIYTIMDSSGTLVLTMELHNLAAQDEQCKKKIKNVDKK